MNQPASQCRVVNHKQSRCVVGVGASIMALMSLTGCLSVPRMETSDRAYVCGNTRHVNDTVVRVLDAPQWRFSDLSDCPSGSMLTPVPKAPKMSQAALDGVLKQSALNLRGLPMFGRPGEVLPVPPWLKPAVPPASATAVPAESPRRDAAGK